MTNREKFSKTKIKDKIKAVWICSVSNPTLRSNLDLRIPWWRRLLIRMTGKGKPEDIADYAQWNSNAIEEFEKIEEVELHVIFAHRQMRNNVQRFKERNICFYAVRGDDCTIMGSIRSRLYGTQWIFDRSNSTIAKLVEEIQPDIVHLQGAEMLVHSPSVLLISHEIPCIVQLETLLQDPIFLQYNPQLFKQKECEEKVLKRADYIGSKNKRYPSVVRSYVKKDAVFVNTRLILGEKGDMTPCEKIFDFVYFANYINKAVDLAVEAFCRAYQKNPNLTLDIIGGVYESEIREINARLEEWGCKEAVTIEGKLPSHEDVIKQVRKARFALLPLKIDSISGTIREAMWNGLPVISTITVGTPQLNVQRESIILSPIGDHEAMAENMLLLKNNSEMANRLRTNGYKTVEERYGNNAGLAKEWVDVYRACMNNFYHGISLPDTIINSN